MLRGDFHSRCRGKHGRHDALCLNVRHQLEQRVREHNPPILAPGGDFTGSERQRKLPEEGKAHDDSPCCPHALHMDCLVGVGVHGPRSSLGAFWPGKNLVPQTAGNIQRLLLKGYNNGATGYPPPTQSLRGGRKSMFATEGKVQVWVERSKGQADQVEMEAKHAPRFALRQ